MTCSSGFICLDKQYIGVMILGLLVLAVYFMKTSDTKVKMIKSDLEDTKNTFLSYAVNRDIVSTPMYNLEYDYQRIVNPLLPPERSYPYRPTRVGLPININTRGPSSGFQQMGFLQEEGGNGENKLLPLYGEQTYPGSNQYRYYTSSDGFQSVKLPITNKSKDCMDEYGCDELYDKDNVTVRGYNKNYKVELYKIDRPRYNPYVI
jgi:hypothetical protein